MDIVYFHRHIDANKYNLVIQSLNESLSQRWIARLTYNTEVNIRQASKIAQMIHNQEVKVVETTEISSNEMWSFLKKTEELFIYLQRMSKETVEFWLAYRSEWADFDRASGKHTD